MSKTQFKAESKRLLDLMIHSIYTNKEIFIREIISNASDALDKRHFVSLTDETKRLNNEDLSILIELNKELRTITITDNGIGMTKDELSSNLGTIAKSGSLEFKKELEKNEETNDIIGQFGVGFYSAFIVAKKVIVETKSVNDDTAYSWVSKGADGYTISPILKDTIGTKIIIELNDNTDDINYDEFLDPFTIKNLVTKYSDYVRYPIKLELEKYIPSEKEGEEGQTVAELQTVNSMVPLWKKAKKDITTEEYNEFYKTKFQDWQDPTKSIHYNIEGNVSYSALLYIPSHVPFNFYSNDFVSGLKLYSKGVFILDNTKDLLPDHFRFVKGLVDSNDINLNISREILQQDTQVKALSKSIEKKIKSALTDMLKNDRENYEKFFDNFGVNLKFGLYNNYGQNKDELKDLVLFKSSLNDTYTTFSEYVSRMKENQTSIYFASGESIDLIKKLPQIERVIDQGYEVLYLVDNIDEFAINMLGQYEEKQFKSINQGDLDLDTKEEKEELIKEMEDNKDLLTKLSTSLDGKVKEVVISSRLKSHPVCLVSAEGLSIEMEKVLKNNPDSKDLKATKILEINKDHEIFKTLQNLYTTNETLIDDYAYVLYNQALLIEGLTIEDPVEYANKICNLMVNK